MFTNKLIDRYSKLPKQAKASFWFLICMILQKGINILTTPIFTRLLNPELYGEYSSFTSWESILAVFVTLKLTSGVYTQGLVKFHEKKAEFSVAMQGLSTFIIFCFSIVYALFYQFFNNIFGLNTYQMISLFVILWTGEIFSFWLCEKRVEYEYKFLVIISIIVSVAKPLAGIFAILAFDEKVTARIISMAVINLIFYTPFLIVKFREKKPFISRKIWKYALVFNLPLIPHYLSQTVLSKADVIMIRDMIGVDKAGIYNLAYQLAMILLIINSAMMQTMTPWIYGKIRDKQIGDIKGVAYLSLVAIAILNLLLIVFAPEVIMVFAPPEFYEAIWIIPPIAMSGVFIFSYDLFSSYQFYFEKTFFVMIASIAGAAINIALNYIFIPIYGYMVAGYTTLVCYIFYAFGHYVFMNKICREKFPDTKPYDIKILLIIYITFMLISFAIMFTYSNIVLRIFATLLLVCIPLIFRRKIMYHLKNAISFDNGKMKIK
ncbi:MAG: oligosaccharide flippase family protein [Eubacteriales bacterium]|nr:oligosaccharide flippase family protein [Eubacteriales bacterium]MDY3332714.1 oligosaccharide flippase family protein [Gallibacter sp.]